MLYKKILFVCQSANYGGTGRYFKQTVNYLLHNQEYTKIVIFVEKEFLLDVKSYIDSVPHNKVLVVKSLSDFWLSRYKKYQTVDNIYKKIKYYIDILKQKLYVEYLVFMYKPDKIWVSIGYPWYLLSFAFARVHTYFVYHVMPLNNFHHEYGNFRLKVATSNSKVSIVTVSNFSKEMIIKNHFKDKYINVVNNSYEIGINQGLNKFSNYTQQFRSINPLFSEYLEKKSDTKYLFITISRLEESKNVALWIELANYFVEKFSDVSFVWAGGGGAYEKYKSMEKDEKSIFFLGHIDDVDSLYKLADVYLEPSFRESHGISVVGAMKHGLPVVATSFGGTQDSIDDGITGFLIDPENKMEWIRKIEYLLNHPDQIQMLGYKGKEKYDSNLTFSHWTSKMDKLINLNCG